MSTGQYSFLVFLMAHCPILHSLLFFDEEVQVNGMTIFHYFGDFRMNLMTWIGLDGLKQASEYNNVGTASQHRQLYLSPVMRKGVFGSFRPGQTQTGLRSHSS